MASQHRRVKVKIPSSSANLASGFDILAVAHDAFHDEVEINISGEGYTKIKLTIEGSYSDKIPSNIESNVVTIPILKLLNTLNEKLNLEIRVRKEIPPGKGLGSSGASSIGGVIALNKLLGDVLTYKELLNIAVEGEKAVAGSPHYDNIAASLLGGFVLVDVDKDGFLVDAYKLSNGSSFRFLLIVPHIEVSEYKTMYSRKIIPNRVSLSDHIRNSVYLALLIYGITTDNPEVAGKGFNDNIVEPARASLIPLYSRVKDKALEMGAYGVAISGAGPSIIILANSDIIDELGRTINKIYSSEGYNVSIIKAKPCSGAIETATL